MLANNPLTLMFVLAQALATAANADDPTEAPLSNVPAAVVTRSMTLLPRSTEQIQMLFECEDGLEVEIKWIAEDVGEAAPRNFEIDTATLTTQGPLNIASLSKPTKGFPAGLYRAELWNNGKRLHAELYLLADVTR